MAQVSTTIPLTDLCAICHVNPIKYTCPRDGTHTCSLACVKRHKQWAQCSGVRDPAEYRRRTELATPASIDKDFNFITRVERSISRADDVAANRGIGLTPARLEHSHPRPRLDVEIDAQAIKVIKAPKGLSRSKQNQTQWSGQAKCIVWSVEWLCQDGRRVMSRAPENRSVKDLFISATANKQHSKKRKRRSGVGEQTAETEAIDKESKANTAVSTSKHHLQSHQAQQEAENGEVPEVSNVEAEAQEDQSSSSPVKERYFYLHKPDTESRYKCLILLPPDKPLQELLNKRTLIEFPTIHVRHEPPEQLDLPFITEEEYLRRHGDDIPITVTAALENVTNHGDLEEGELVEGREIPSNIDETIVLEVLARDLSG